MNFVKPKMLKLGDKIGIISPAGCVEDENGALAAKKYFECLGYKIVFGKHIFNKNKYLAGTDEEKLEDLHNFFADDEIKAILCLRGGYGCIRLINKINYDLIKNNPKFFAGYSDITALCVMFLKRAGLITYHAPLFASDFGCKSPSNYTFAGLLNAFAQYDGQNVEASKIYKKGEAEGILFGGNLSTLVSLCGTDFLPDEKFIFFAEDLNEPVYKIDRMFTQLMNIQKFRENVQGIILGDFLDVDNEDWLNNLFNELAEELNVPVLGGFKITHAKDKMTLPLGVNAKIENNILSFDY